MKTFFANMMVITQLFTVSVMAERPNILLVLSDDHSVPHLGAYGDVNCTRLNLTPNLDDFAEQSMRFTRAYTAAPQCAPSRISIFAGRSPVGISSTRFAQPARPGTPFVTDLLRAAGYWVGLDGRHQHLDGQNKDAPHVTETLEQLGMRGPLFESRFDHFVRGAKTKGEYLKNVPGMFGAVLDEVPADKPFFLYFGFNQPHRKWGDDHEGIDPAELKLPGDWPDLPEVRLDYSRYLAEVRDLDIGFGMIMKVLAERGLDKNTLVFFMGDNGEALLRGKGTLFSRGLNVPLMVRWPGKVQPGSVSDVLISGIDLAPTMLSAAGVAPDEGMTGQDFKPLLLDQAFEGQEQIFGERSWHFGPITRTDGFDLSRSVVTKRYNFIYNGIPERSYTPVDMAKKNVAWEAIKAAHQEGHLEGVHERIFFQNPRPIFELYDLEKDPFELNNLAGQAAVADVEVAMREKLDCWMVREGDYMPLPAHAFKNMERD
ncbi:Choline-sulfatase [Pontiella sulfatireligans]|uniref:Choline-sulfatase n=2 Tax=Pontiella sulfatireligans TaxID=2750658 RepID=A0A6C2UKD4_9BACT|nr:sulfatase S1_8 [Kiritimatiellales bacterium]VGO20695.1 Choline-sulfatase [Pontiella sulfatireligans]